MMRKNMVASVLARLRNIAKTRNVIFGEILLRYAVERVLKRIEESEYASQCILKGGAPLAYAEWRTNRLCAGCRDMRSKTHEASGRVSAARRTRFCACRTRQVRHCGKRDDTRPHFRLLYLPPGQERETWSTCLVCTALHRRTARCVSLHPVRLDSRTCWSFFRRF